MCDQPAKRRRKGLRTRFYRVKNDERKSQKENHAQSKSCTSKVTRNTGLSNADLNITNSSDLQGSHVEQSGSSKLHHIKDVIQVPNGWQCIDGSDMLEYVKVEKVWGNSSITRTLSVRNDLTWQVISHGHVVPSSNQSLSKHPKLLNPSDCKNILCEVDQLHACPGNPDADFVEMCEKRGGVIKGDRGHGEVVAYLDTKQVLNMDEINSSSTVRRKDCGILCSKPGRCGSCVVFRRVLRTNVYRGQKAGNESRSSINSRTSYAHLTSKEKDGRLRNFQKMLVSTKQRVAKLENKIEELIIRDGVILDENNAADVQALYTEMSSVVDSEFSENSPQRILWEQQKRYNSLKSKTQMKWHPLVIRFALNLKYLSSSAYTAVRKSGFLSLPSERTLRDYTHWTSAHHGIQLEFVEQFLELMEKEVKGPSKSCALCMDEMKIKSGLVFSRRSGDLVGFVNLGSVNRDIEHLLSDGTETEQLASHMLVFMARAIFKPSLVVPIAHFPSSKLAGKFLSGCHSKENMNTVMLLVL